MKACDHDHGFLLNAEEQGNGGIFANGHDEHLLGRQGIDRDSRQFALSEFRLHVGNESRALLAGTRTIRERH